MLTPGQTYPTTMFGTVNFPTADNHIIRLTVTGKNSASSGFVLSADKFTFTPVQTEQQVAALSLQLRRGGNYTTTQMVAITSATSSASIHYTTDGSMPTETTGTVYSGPVSISGNTTLQAIAFESGLIDSTVTSATYTFGSVQTFNFEAESLSPVGSGATVSISNDANASGGVIEFLNSTAAGQTITFTTPSMPAGTYQLQLRYKTNTTRGQHTVTVDGIPVGSTLDQYALNFSLSHRRTRQRDPHLFRCSHHRDDSDGQEHRCDPILHHRRQVHLRRTVMLINAARRKPRCVPHLFVWFADPRPSPTRPHPI